MLLSLKTKLNLIGVSKNIFFSQNEVKSGICAITSLMLKVSNCQDKTLNEYFHYYEEETH